MVEITVIIPAYNAIDYLDESLNSIINQTFTDLEIICVDDGSTDNTLERLYEYAEKDSRIQVYTQENQGPGGATNTGLDKATGKYIYLMDADDILDLNALEEFHTIMEEKDVDLIIFPSIDYDEDTGKYEKQDYFSMPEINEAVGDTIFHWRDLSQNLLFKICVTPWSKFYKHDLIKKSNARFPTNTIYQDNPFFWEIIFNTEKIYFYNKFLYTRRTHSASCTHSNDERNIDSIKINNIIIKTFMKYGHFEEFKVKLYHTKISLINRRYNEIRDEFKELYFSEMKKDYVKIIGHEKYDDFKSCLNLTNTYLFDNAISSSNHVEYDLKNEISALEMDKTRLTKEKDSSIKQVNALKKENKKLAKLNKSLLTSKSWKLTKPLRTIGRIRK